MSLSDKPIETADESSKVVVDAVWPSIKAQAENEYKFTEYQVWYSDSTNRISKRKTFRHLEEAEQFAWQHNAYQIDRVVRTVIQASHWKASKGGPDL